MDDVMHGRAMAVLLGAGALLGAVVPTVFLFLYGVHGARQWTEMAQAYVLFTLTGAMLGFAAWMIYDHRAYWRNRP